MVKSKRDFGEGFFFTITNYIYWFVLGNFYFTLTNIPMVYILFTICVNRNKPIPPSLFPVIFLCCLPIGPGATALFSVMGKLVRERDINITKDFFRAYRLNFRQSICIWTFELIALTILLLDLKYLVYQSFNPIYAFFMLSILIFIMSMGLYIFPLLSRFNMKSLNILKLSAYYTIRKIHITLANLSSLIVFGFIFFRLSTFVLVFFLSVSCYLIMYYERKLFNDIEARIEGPSLGSTKLEELI